MKNRSTIMSVLFTLALPVAGNCADAPKAAGKTDAAVEAKKTEMKGHSSLTGGSAAAAEGLQAPSGKVVETMESGGYSYANLENNGKTVWVAFPTQATRIGDTLSFGGCTEMRGFQSKSLNRSFDLIYFCQRPSPQGKAAEAKPAAMAGKKSSGGNGAVSAASQIKVDKASGANAYTVAQLYAKSAELNGKQVSVRGQVVKVSSAIMGRNWIHLQDGSGNDKQKTNKVVVTSAELPKVGEVVTVSGILVKDKDFGSGYKYSVIIEKASVQK